MLELAILGLLKEKAMHGYELRRQLTQKLGHFWSVSWGSLYPTLRRLEKRGLVEKVFADDGTARRKNIYRVTAAGEDEFLELIADRPHSAWDEDKFPLRLAFFRWLTPEIRIRLLERRRAYLTDRLADLDDAMRHARDRIDSYTLALLEHNQQATAADIAWLDGLISAERRQTGEPTTPPDPRSHDRAERTAGPTREQPTSSSPTTGERATARSRP